jgi:hypothetical protein
MTAISAAPFIVGSTYSRQEIHDILGGSVRAYLPYLNGRVVCGCFDPSDKMNPNAPEEILFGEPHDAPLIDETADMVFQQGKDGDDIPVFLKESTNRWKYVGQYLCIGITRDLRVVKRKMKANPSRRPFVGVLRFERVA